MLKYTKEIQEYIRDNCLGNSGKNLVKELYDKFKFKITINGLRTYMNTKRYRFTDIKIKKPKRNWNQHRVGDERVKKGMVQVKIKEPNKWKQKQVYLYEQAHKEKVKKNEIVIFLDGNNRNFEIKNLYKISRKVNLVRNKWVNHINGLVAVQIAEIKSLVATKKKTLLKRSNNV